MSKEAVIELIEAAESNPTLLKELHSAQGPETVLTIAAERGFEFSESELLSVMQEKQLSFASEDLSDEQLEAIAGGKGNVTANTYTETTYNGKIKGKK
ncbi:Nif11-like leader peptide family natural product precursor [Nostoc sp.]|uniref:Nif11-like leader peptide family natural product precursor n=1 Tax=Nostoc sp. TaxID=1180 RepID=UPI002FFA403F